MQRVKERFPVKRPARQFDQRDLETVQADCIKHQCAVRQAGRRNIDQQFVESYQGFAIRFGQLQLGQTQAQVEGVELRSIHAQVVTGFFCDELFRLRLDDARQRKPEKQQGDDGQPESGDCQFLEQRETG